MVGKAGTVVLGAVRLGRPCVLGARASGLASLVASRPAREIAAVAVAEEEAVVVVVVVGQTR